MADSDPVEEAVRLHEHAVRERVAGRPAEALPGCLDALAILERELGPSSPDLAGVLNTVGAIREGLSEYGEAAAAYRRAAAILAAIEGEDEVLVRLRVQTLANLAGIERAQGRLDEAERLFLDALELAEASFDPGGRELASLLNNLAMVYKYAARFDEAEALYRRALAAVEASLGPEHPEAAAIWHNLGGIEHARGRLAEGEPFARRSVEIREAALGADHPAVAADVAALAALVQEQGRLDEAEALYRRTVAVFEAALGPDHYELGVSCNNLGALKAAQGDLVEAEARRALSIFEASFGAEHPKTRTCRRELEALRQGPEAEAADGAASAHGGAGHHLVVIVAAHPSAADRDPAVLVLRGVGGDDGRACKRRGSGQRGDRGNQTAARLGGSGALGRGRAALHARPVGRLR